MKALFLSLALLASAVTPRAVAAAEIDDLAARLAGGAKLAAGVARGPADAFEERARRFADVVRRGAPRRDVESAWHRTRTSYLALRSANRNASDDRWRFLLGHLDTDVAAIDRIVGTGRADESDSDGTTRTLSLLRSEVCVGRNPTDRRCPEPRDVLSFRLPRDASAIRRIDVEWRDFGRDAKGEVYVDDRLVWREDVNKDWDGDGKKLDLEVRGRSRITIRSSNGDPIWIRKLTVEVVD
jgi:hypothetical protein